MPIWEPEYPGQRDIGKGVSIKTRIATPVTSRVRELDYANHPRLFLATKVACCNGATHIDTANGMIGLLNAASVRRRHFAADQFSDLRYLQGSGFGTTGIGRCGRSVL